MTTCLGKSCSVFSNFPFGFEGRISDLNVSVPDHCLSFYLGRTVYIDLIKWIHINLLKVGS